MARIRQLHPSQWGLEDFVACPMAARLLLLGLRNHADDRGVFEWRPLTIKMAVFPGDDVDVAQLLDELLQHDQIARFEVDGRIYGVCVDWYQRTEKPSYRYPPPPSAITIRGSLSDRSGIARGAAGEPTRESESGIVIGGERAAAIAEQSAPAGAALSLDFDLPEEWRTEAAEGRRKAGLSEANLDAEWLKFRKEVEGQRQPLAVWQRRWFRWAMNANAERRQTSPVPADASAGSASPPSRLRRPSNWNDYPAKWRSCAVQWVELGGWSPSAGPPPGQPGCEMPAALQAWAMAERARIFPELKPPIVATLRCHAAVQRNGLTRNPLSAPSVDRVDGGRVAPGATPPRQRGAA